MYWIQRVDRTAVSQRSADVWPHHWQAEASDIREYWIPTRDHLFLIVGIVFIVELLTFAFLLTATPLYTSTSTILIEREAPEVLESTRPSEESQSGAETFYATQYEMLRSHSLAAGVIRNHDLEHNPSFTGAGRQAFVLNAAFVWLRTLVAVAAGWIQLNSAPSSSEASEPILGVSQASIETYLAGLTVRPVFGTRMVSISYSSRDPALAAEIANAHVREFIRLNYMRHAQTSEEAQHYLGGKLSDLESRMERSEAALNTYRRQRGIVEFSLDDRNQMISDRLTDLNHLVMGAEAGRIGLEAELQTIKDHDYDSLPEVINSPLIQRLKEECALLEGRYANLSDQYTSDYPPVAQLKSQLEDLRARERAEVKKVVDSVETRYKSAVERENELNRNFTQEKAQAMGLKDASLREAVLERDVETNRALYQSILERIKTLGVASESQMTNVTLVDPAEIASVPSSPKKKLSLVVSGFLALLLGVGIAFILEASDRGLKSADEVQTYLQLPALASVLHFAVLDETKSRSLGWLVKPSETRREPAIVPTDVAAPRFRFMLDEAYRAIRTGILLSQSERAPKIILFSSAIPGEGKSWTAASSAIMFAQLHDRVLLIDADLRRPRCHSILGRNCSPGLTEVLTGSTRLDEAIQPTALKGLSLLSAGGTPPHPTELLASQRMREILAAATSSYQHVLIDSPPILPLSDSVVLSTLVDGVVVVVSSETVKTLVRDACARLQHVGSKILGVVLTKVDPKRQRQRLPSYDPVLHRF